MMSLNEKKLDRLRDVNTEQAYNFFCTVVINIYVSGYPEAIGPPLV